MPSERGGSRSLPERTRKPATARARASAPGSTSDLAVLHLRRRLRRTTAPAVAVPAHPSSASPLAGAGGAGRRRGRGRRPPSSAATFSVDSSTAPSAAAPPWLRRRSRRVPTRADASARPTSAPVRAGPAASWPRSACPGGGCCRRASSRSPGLVAQARHVERGPGLAPVRRASGAGISRSTGRATLQDGAPFPRVVARRASARRAAAPDHDPAALDDGRALLARSADAPGPSRGCFAVHTPSVSELSA